MTTQRTRAALGFWLLMALILLAAYALRVRGLDGAALTWDEGYSTWIMRLPIGQLLETTARDVHPPLYYLTLRAYADVLGVTQGEFTLRYLSVLLGLVSAALVYALGAAIGGRWTGVLAAALLVIARANIDIARDTRMHMMAMLWVTLALWAAVRWFKQPDKPRWLMVYAGGMLGALFTFYLTGMALIVTNVAFIVWWWQRRRPIRPLIQWGVTHVAVMLVFIPWGLYTYGLLLRGPSPAPMLSPLVYIQFYVISLALGFPTYSESYIPIYAAVLLVMGAGAWLMIRRTRGTADARVPLLMAGVTVPLVVVLMASLPFHGLARPVAARYFLSLSAAFYVLAAWSIVLLMRQRRAWGGVALVIVFGAALYGLLPALHDSARRDLFVSISQTLEAHRVDGDALVLNNDKTWPPLAAKYPDATRHDIPYASTITADSAPDILRPIWRASEAVWLITTPESLVSDPTQALAAWLESRAVESRHWTFNEYALAVYARTPQRAATLDALAPSYALPRDAQLIHAQGLVAVHQPLTRYEAGDAAHLALFWQTPPTSAYQVALADADGIVRRTVTLDAPNPSPNGLTRQVIRVPLTLDLPTGEYSLYLMDSSVTLARLWLVVNKLDMLNQAVDSIPNALNLKFGDSITLLGYEVSATRARAGDLLTVRLFWRADAPIDTRYKVIVYALGGFNAETGNPLWGQQDSEPFNWEIPTTAWPTGLTLVDTYNVRLSPNTPRGEYQIGLAMYAQIGGQRLTVTEADGAPLGDSPILTIVQVE